MDDDRNVPGLAIDRAPRSVLPARSFARTCATVDERNVLNARFNTAYKHTELSALASAGFRSRMFGLDTGTVRVVAMRESGDVRIRSSWRDDAFGAWFAWRTGETGTAPNLTVAGLGTEWTKVQEQEVCTLLVSVRGAMVETLRRRAAADGSLEPWLRAGIRWPGASAALEWRLQRLILRAAAMPGDARARGVDIDPVIDRAGERILANLVDLLQDARRPAPDQRSSSDRRRLVEAALERVEAVDGTPASIGGVCLELGVSERTLQRAFQEVLGVGLRAYERDRRLRIAHGAILAEGDRRTVTEIAMGVGFWHLGRFAGAYKALFGCAPSETRQQAWHIRD